MLPDEENEFKFRIYLAFNWNSCLLNHNNLRNKYIIGYKFWFEINECQVLFVEQLQIDQC